MGEGVVVGVVEGVKVWLECGGVEVEQFLSKDVNIL